MFPNFNAEYARKGFTLQKLSDEMKERGIYRTVTTLSQKLNGKLDISFNEAKLMRDIVAPEMTIDELFQERE